MHPLRIALVALSLFSFFAGLPLQAMEDEPVLFAIPRIATNEYREEGIYRGGSEEAAGIRSLKREETPSQGGERWTLEFSSPAKKRKGAPFFQVKLVKASRSTSKI